MSMCLSVEEDRKEGSNRTWIHVVASFVFRIVSPSLQNHQETGRNRKYAVGLVPHSRRSNDIYRSHIHDKGMCCFPCLFRLKNFPCSAVQKFYNISISCCSITKSMR